MPRRISIVQHLSTEQLKQAYQQSKDGLESRQYQIIWLLATGKTTEEVQQITGYSRIWIYELVKRYNQLGVEGYCDRRKKNPGAKPLIGDVEQAQLWQALQEKSLLRRIMEWSQGSRLADLCNWTLY